MKRQLNQIYWSLLITVTVGCSPFRSSNGNLQNQTSTVNPIISANASNVMPITVGCGLANILCVTVTVCQPGTQNCVSVPNVMLDTGSSGLRLFSSTISSLGLQPLAVGGSNQLAECISYLDQSSDWGPIVQADLKLGAQTASNVYIQSVNANFPGRPSTCLNPDTSPASVGFNGILGVGLFVADCGPSCANSSQNQVYYSCSNGNCSNIAVPEANQVSNPVSFLPADNNGVAIQLANVPSLNGAPLTTGYLVFGVATQPNNTPIGAKLLTADGNGNFATIFQGQSYSHSFIDSGSNALYFPQVSGISICNNNNNAKGFYCPPSFMTFSATQIGANGNSASVNFSIGNAEALMVGTNMNAFTDLSGPNSSGFDWGSPFFIGRTIYVGLEGRSSSLGSGTYWAW